MTEVLEVGQQHMVTMHDMCPTLQSFTATDGQIHHVAQSVCTGGGPVGTYSDRFPNFQASVCSSGTSNSATRRALETLPIGP